VHFSESTRHGERFLYNVNYVERTADFIASHFGTPMATAVFELKPDSETWRGPFESSYGYHVVMLTRRTDGNQPELSEIEAAVRDDAERIAINELNELAVQAIVDTYDVRMDYELENGE